MRHPVRALALLNLLLLTGLGVPLPAQTSAPASTPAAELAAPVVVRLETELGAIDLEIDLVHAPRSAANFLHYVDAGRYDGGRFHRTVRADNETRPDVPIEVVQAGVAPGHEAGDPPPIALERTRDTGLRHLAGTISMARDTPDSATSDFFVCLTDLPALDFGGARNPDGQGFAAFGRVTRGLEVLRGFRRHTPPARASRRRSRSAARPACADRPAGCRKHGSSEARHRYASRTAWGAGPPRLSRGCRSSPVRLRRDRPDRRRR